MTFSEQDLSHVHCVPEAPQLTKAENYNWKVIWAPNHPLTTTQVSLWNFLPHTLRLATYTKSLLTEFFLKKKKVIESKLIKLYTYQLYTCSLFYVNDASINLFFKSRLD